MSVLAAYLSTLKKVGPVVDITGLNSAFVSQFSASPNSAFAGIRIRNNGTVDTTNFLGTYGYTQDWIDPTSAAGSAYELRVTVTSGALTASSGTGTWLSLATNREYSCFRDTPGTATATLTLEIRRSSDGTVLSTATGVILTASVDL